MPPTPPALAYRRAAAQQASVVGLVIALYDTLAGDLQRAVLAMQQRDLEQRGVHLKHGFAVLIQLLSLVDTERGGLTAVHLQQFYEHLRREMLRAQFAQDASILEQAHTLLLDVRGAWQEVDSRSSGTAPFHQTEKAGGHPAAPLSCLA